MSQEQEAHPIVRHAARLIDEYIRLDRAVPVRPTVSPEELVDRLSLRLDGAAHGLDEVVDALSRVMAATPTTTSARFFNQLFGGRDDASTIAEIIAAVANSPMYTFKSGGPQILIEREVIGKLASYVGFASADGVFAPGGSISNLAAMILARNETVEGAREHGLPGERLMVYTSSECHYSIRKGASMIGLGRRNVRYVDVDERGRMRPGALRRMIIADRDAGHVPIMINATSGTTVQGAFDPLRDIAGVARELGVWMHVDGAYGGSILLSATHRHLLDGCELADSFTWDPHKLMGVPLTSSVLLTKQAGLCRRHFDEAAPYLYQEDTDDLNPGRASLQCGRHNDALKVWAAWKHHGDEGLAGMIDRLFELSRYCADQVEAAPDLALAKYPDSLNVCFEATGKSSRLLCGELGRLQKAKIGYGIVDGRFVVRVVFVNPRITTADIDAVLADIRAVAVDLPEADNAVRPEHVESSC